MKKYLLLLALAICMLNLAFAQDKNAGDDELLRKSIISEPPGFNPNPPQSSFPAPFTEIGNSVTSPAVSTGYYFVDSQDDAPDYWRPIPEIIDTTTEPTTWRRIISGPRQRDPQYWTQNPSEGLRFFRNPALPLPSGDFFNGPTDSTDDAIAGPIPIGFSFYFNGLRFDSFYVSTNGIIALTNRRYTYDDAGNRTILPGATSAYDPMSMDWFDGNRNRSSVTGLDDALPDNYGYQYAVLGNNQFSAQGGIRARGGSLNTVSSPYKAHVIAPFYGDLQLSQFKASSNQPDDQGKVFFKRFSNADRLLIWIINASPIRGLNSPVGGFTGSSDLRLGDYNYLAASAQVTLDKRDSSVLIVYPSFDGVAVVNGRSAPCASVFRYNTTCGVRGFARYTNYGQPGGPVSPWAGEYEQYTHYFSSFANPNASYPDNLLAIKFKQWKNTIRVVDIQYRVRKADPNAGLDFTEPVPSTKVNNYELLAGEERIGAIQPIAILQNLTNQIQGPQGINFQPQALNFRARFRIINEATQRIIYNRLVPIDSTCLALPDSLSYLCTGDPYVKIRYSSVAKASGNYTATPLAFPGTNNLNGIPPYGFVQVSFPPFEPNEFVQNHIGRMLAYIIADPTDPQTSEGLRDQWPFDDTTNVRIFVMKRLSDFSDDVTEYHYINTYMPSVWKWVNIDAECANGDDVSYYPLPPRGEYVAANNPDVKLRSPVIRMNRLTLDKKEPAVYPGGDEIRSFPIDLRGRYGAVLSASFQRLEKRNDFPRNWSDQNEVGIEPRTVVNSDIFHVWSDYSYAVSQKSNDASGQNPQGIAIEIAQPSPDGVQFITNIDDKRWRNNFRRGGAKPVTDMPAYFLYGAGGTMRGFLESDRDSALSRPGGGLRNGLREDLFDDGIDWEYKKAFVNIPDTIIKSPNEGAKNFRFRIKSYFYYDKKCDFCIPDDEDTYFVDNVKLLFPSEITDIEISNVRVLWPYTMAPASQAIKIPIRVKIANNTSVNAPTFLVKVKIYKGDYKDQNYPPPSVKPIYCRFIQVPFMYPGSEEEIAMPNWDARSAGPGKYRLYGHILVQGGDLEPLNDTTYSDFQLTFGDVFAYENNPNQPVSDVENAAYTGIIGRGLNMFGFAVGGTGSVGGGSFSSYDEENYGAGTRGGSGSGSIAMKFQMFQPDTIYGFKVYWAKLNQSLDDIALAIYTDVGGNPGQQVANTGIYGQRGWDAKRSPVTNQTYWDEYILYLLPRPVVLPSGNFWTVVSQLGETGMELGASHTRTGMRTTSIYIPPPTTMTGPVGGAGINLMLDKNFRKLNPQRNLINNNFFAYENSRQSGQWVPFMPTVGNPGYAHLHHFGLSPSDQQTATLSRGTWIPMIRPYLGQRASGTNPEYQVCADDLPPVYPVELSTFDGIARSNGVALYWETASEIDNAGFYVEKKTKTAKDWQAISFVKGAGNSQVPLHYDYFDKEVSSNSVYLYRLRQVDKDGSLNCNVYSKVVEIQTPQNSGYLTLENSPNPFTSTTKITYNVPEDGNVKLEVLDVLGNVVSTLKDEYMHAHQYETDWNGFDSNGRPVANGTYIYRLTVGDNVMTNKMSVIR